MHMEFLNCFKDCETSKNSCKSVSHDAYGPGGGDLNLTSEPGGTVHVE